MTQPLVPATLVGSLPRPRWLLASPTRADAVWGEWQPANEHLQEGQDDAVRAVVLDMLNCGLNIVTDGEQRRRHYIWGFLEGIEGVDFTRIEPKRTRGNRYTHPAPTVVSPLRWTGPVHARDAAFLREQVSVRPGTRTKITLPGPMTVADSVHDTVYGDTKALALAVAGVLHEEAMALSELGCDVVQFDEPTFNIYLDDVEAWGIEALNQAVAGVTARRAVHVCYGYGGSEAADWKRSNSDWAQYERLLPLLASSDVDQLALEFTMPRLDPAVLQLAGTKTILFGAVDTGWDSPEPVSAVADRLRQALRYVPAERLQASSDCGFATISRDLARAKLTVLAQAAAVVREEFAMPKTGTTDASIEHLAG